MSHTSCGNGLFALPALYGAAYVLVGQLNAVHGGEDLPQHGNHGFKARHLARLQVLHDLGHGLLDGIQRGFHVGAVALVAQHRQKLPVGRDDRALCQVGNLRGGQGADMKPDMPAAEYVRQVERQPVQRVDDRIDAGHNGGDHPVDEADDAIDGGLDGTGDAVPDVRNRLPKGIECLSSFSADVIPCVYKILLEVTQPAGDVLPLAGQTVQKSLRDVGTPGFGFGAGGVDAECFANTVFERRENVIIDPLPDAVPECFQAVDKTIEQVLSNVVTVSGNRCLGLDVIKPLLYALDKITDKMPSKG